MQGNEILIVFGFVALVGAIIGLKFYFDKKRREAYQALANQLGLEFYPQKDRSLSRQMGFLNSVKADGFFSGARNQYAINVLRGELQGHRFRSFEYHYETRSTSSDGKTRTQHHWFTIFTLSLPKHFPELLISPEGLFSKIGQALGFDDIDFESVEFSRRYCVRSKDKKLAYDFCNAQMIQYLLRQSGLTIELEGVTLALTERGRSGIEEVRSRIEQLLEIRSHMPDYLFKE